MKPLELGISLKSGRPPKKATLVYIGNEAGVNRRTLEPQRANWARFLLGLENTDEQTLELYPQGRTDRDRSRGHPPDAPSRHPVHGQLGRRLCKGYNCEAESTDAPDRGGLLRSSVEAG